MSGLVASALRLRLHQRTHEEEVGVRVAPSVDSSAEESVTARLTRRSLSGSSSDLTDSSSDSGWGDTGREEINECRFSSAASRHVTSASMSGEPSCRLIYLIMMF